MYFESRHKTVSKAAKNEPLVYLQELYLLLLPYYMYLELYDDFMIKSLSGALSEHATDNVYYFIFIISILISSIIIVLILIQILSS